MHIYQPWVAPIQLRADPVHLLDAMPRNRLALAIAVALYA